MWYTEKHTPHRISNGKFISMPPHYDPARDTIVCGTCHLSEPKYSRHFTIRKDYPIQLKDRHKGPKPTPPPMPKLAPPPVAKPDIVYDLKQPITVNAKTRRTKKWQRIVKNWQLFILLITDSEGRIVKKQLDKYKLALKTFRSAMAKFDEK